MRAYQIFASMSPEHSEAFFRVLAENSPGAFTQAVYAAAAAFKSRPGFLAKQPFERRASMVRRALARVATNAVAEEILAVYYLECKLEILTDWLDELGIEHEDGILKEDSPAEPAPEKVREAVEKFRSRDDDPDRELLLHAFCAQSAIDWPLLEETIGS